MNNILRLLVTRGLLILGLIAALALPFEAVTQAAETSGGKVAQKSATKKSGKRATRKTAKHKAKKSAKKPAKKSARKSVKKTAKNPARKVAVEIPAPAAAAPAPLDTAAVFVSAARDGANIRTTPADGGEIASEVFTGFPLKIKKRQGAWLQVADFEGETGWIHESLVAADRSVIVCKKKINLRQDPNDDVNNPIVAVARYGVVFTAVEKKADWLKVRYDDGTEGWLSKGMVWPSEVLD